MHEPISPYAAPKRSGALLDQTFRPLYDITGYCVCFFPVWALSRRAL